MVYIIIKTNKNLESELVSVHDTKEQASFKLTQLCNRIYINRIINGSVLKVYENNYLLRNNSLFLYQIINVTETNENNNIIKKNDNNNGKKKS